MICFHLIAIFVICLELMKLRGFFLWLLGVLHTSVVLLTEMCERSPDMLAHFRKVSVNLVALQN